MAIRYQLASEARGDFRRALGRAARRGVRRICEVGGGANPTASLKMIRRWKLDYTLQDVSAEELSKAPAGYRTWCADMEDPELSARGDYDLVCSKMTAEHLRDPESFHRNIFRMLRPGGQAVHLFSTLYSPPFVANRLLPEVWSERIVARLQPQRTSDGSHGKFPAYYRWCRGPTASQTTRFHQLGYDVMEYVGYFGHSGTATSGTGYYDRWPILSRLHVALCRGLVRAPIPALTSLSLVRLRRPFDLSASRRRTAPVSIVRVSSSR